MRNLSDVSVLDEISFLIAGGCARSNKIEVLMKKP